MLGMTKFNTSNGDTMEGVANQLNQAEERVSRMGDLADKTLPWDINLEKQWACPQPLRTLRHGWETEPRNPWDGRRSWGRHQQHGESIQWSHSKNSQNLDIQTQDAIRAPSGHGQEIPFLGCIIDTMSTTQSKEAILKAARRKLTKTNTRITSNFLSATLKSRKCRRVL